MSIFESAVIFLCITAILGYINKRFLHFPTTIGVMAISLLSSLIVLTLTQFGFEDLLQYENTLLKSFDFSTVLLNVMLSMLLFAGALHINLHDLRQHQWQVAFLAVFGTVLSAVIVAGLTYTLLPFVGVNISFIWCLVFGALISPTDPISVIGILSSCGAPKSIITVISGESLFNDGIGVVLFLLLVGIVSSGEMPTVAEGVRLFLTEALGGVLFGYVLGKLTYYMLKTIDSYVEEVFLTLAAVLGGYALSHHIGVSGPLAMVVLGLLLGNAGRSKAMSDLTRDYVDMFWRLIDKMLNAILFVLIGIEVLFIHYYGGLIYGALVAIVIALVARFFVVGVNATVFRTHLNLPKGAWRVLTWGGLRGGISIALVLSLPESNERNTLLALTYGIVVFSILVQGLTIRRVARTVQSV